ncbi:hypothetical protein WA556_005222 [Blastocystis sp. ATCC 50177/Nand II]
MEDKGAADGRIHLMARQFYVVKAKGVLLHIDARYQQLKPIGNGNYGIVCSALDAVTNQMVAIKVSLYNPEDMKYNLRIIREVRYLRFFKDCEQVLDIVDFYCYPYTPSIHILSTADPLFTYTITPLYDYDLGVVIDAKNYLSLDQIRLITYQVLLALRYIHSAGFIHRDIKPGNILLTPSADVAICDFGLARSDTTQLTDYVVTRDYRAPELLVGNSTYNSKVDMWSLGVTLAEMFHGSSLFLTGSTSQQLDRALSFLGIPAEEDLAMVENEAVRARIRGRRVQRRPLLQELSRAIPADAADLLLSLLQFNPEKRLSANEALHHRFFVDLVSTLQPADCTEQYDGEWEEGLRHHSSNSAMLKEFIREQQHYPVVKCRYNKL